ncbi:MAG: HDOD domain-containing protein [Mariprofundaceae bacterium]|nr:HDOD domain-containing protein [Mariprofundaceae bacterium]
MHVKTAALAQMIREKFNHGEAKLPVLPEAVIQVRDIVNDASKGASDIAKVIATDPTLSTTVLRIANSAQFKTGHFDIRSLPMAVQRLGGRKTLQLLIVISSQLHVQIKNKQLNSILRNVTKHSLLVAAAAQHLARLIGSCEPEEAFLAGMMYNVGVQAVMSAVPDELAAIPYEQCLSVIEVLHREMGGRLLNHWEMPDIFATVASHHGIEADDRPRDKLIDYIDAADFIVQQSGYPVLFDTIAEGISIESFPPMQRLEVNDIHLAAVEVELEDDAKALGETFQ